MIKYHELFISSIIYFIRYLYHLLFKLFAAYINLIFISISYLYIKFILIRYSHLLVNIIITNSKIFRKHAKYYHVNGRFNF